MFDRVEFIPMAVDFHYTLYDMYFTYSGFFFYGIVLFWPSEYGTMVVGRELFTLGWRFLQHDTGAGSLCLDLLCLWPFKLILNTC